MDTAPDVARALDDAWMRLAAHDDELLMSTGDGTYFTSTILDHLLTHPTGRFLLAENPLCPTAVLAELRHDKDRDVGDSAKANPNLDYALIARSNTRALAHPDCPPERVASLARDILQSREPGTLFNNELYAQLLRHPHLPTDVFETVLRADNPDDMLYLLTNPQTTWIQAQFIRSRLRVHQLGGLFSSWYLDNPNADPAWLADLSATPQSHGYRSLAHPHLDEQVRFDSYQVLKADRCTVGFGSYNKENDFFDTTLAILMLPTLTRKLLSSIPTGRGDITDALLTHPNTDECVLAQLTLDQVSPLTGLHLARRWATTPAQVNVLISLSATWTGTVADLLAASAGIVANNVDKYGFEPVGANR